MSTYATDNPQTTSGIGGAQDYSQFGIAQQLPYDTPDAGAYTDAQYLQDIAGLRSDLGSQYADELGMLGYTDAQGNYVPGSLVRDAMTTEQNAELARQQAILQNTQQAQQQGTLFSGQRAVAQAQAEAPYLQQIAQTEAGLPLDLSSHFTKAAGIVSDFQSQANAALAAAAARGAALAQTNPPADTTGTTTTTPPPTDTTTTTPPPTDTTTYDLLPAYPVRPGPAQYFAGGGEVDGATNAVVGEDGPESIVPRSGLTADENAQLTNLREAAQMRLGGANPPTSGAIHWFGPGGSGVWSPPPRPVDPGPIHLPEQPLGGHVPIAQWIAHHPGAMRTGQFVPHWAALAIAAQNRLRGGIHWPVPGHPSHVIPNPGILPAGGGFAY